ncbi:MAG: DUF4012 domain-containing protein [Kouleothrix sp.]|jgi:hypothetical protein|nr:DUF4012 domain-containing protein [Kouleothrix sp.]
MSTHPSTLLHFPRLAISRPRRLILLLALLALLIGGVKVWRLYQSAQALRQDVAELRAAAGPLDTAHLRMLGPLLARTHADAQDLRAEAMPLLPLAERLGWLPLYGPDLAASRILLDLAVELASAAEEGYIALSPLLQPAEAGQPLPVALVQHLNTAQPELERTRQALTRADALLASLPIDRLVPALGTPLRTLAPLLPAAHDAVALAQALPELLGASGRRDYLLIAQNPDELRATGGLITAAGLLSIEHGRIAPLSMADSGALNDFKSGGPYPEPPAPLRRYMGIDLWVFQDANWSPDLPTAARAIADLYQRGHGQAIDGVILVDPAVVTALLRVTGPLTLPDLATPLTADTALDYMRNSVFLGPVAGERERQLRWINQRKAFMAPLAQAIMAALQQGGAQRDWAGLARVAAGLLAERHIQLAVAQPDAAAVFARRGWDGALRPGNADFLMLVDSNIGYNKATASIQQAISYTVDLSTPAAPLAALNLRYTHRLAGPADCDQSKELKAAFIQRYEDMQLGCYRDYLRAYVPGQAELITAVVPAVPGNWLLAGVGSDDGADVQAGEAGTRAIGALVVVPPGQARRVLLRYRLPAGVLTRDEQGWHYRLALQRQAGAPPPQLSITVRLPRSARFVSASLPASLQPDGSVVIAGALVRDQQLELVFQAP